LTSGHLTIIVVTLLIVVAFPFAAFAVTGNNVFVTDASSGNRATVAGGKLKVDTGLSAFGVVPVAPVAPEIYPTSAIVHTDSGVADFVTANDCTSVCATLLTPPAGKAAVVTSIHVNTYRVTATGSGHYLTIFRSSDASCTLASDERDIEVFNPGAIGETLLQYNLPGGVPVPAGKALCLINGDTTNLAFEVSARGYAVASNAVPSSAAQAGAPKGAALRPKQ